MGSRFGHRRSMIARAITAVSLVALAVFIAGVPMGCSTVDDPPTMPTDPAPPADVTPPPADTPTDKTSNTTNTSKDAIPIGEIAWDASYNPAGWTPITKIEGITIRPNSPAPTICWKWKQPNWPLKGGKSIGNNWIIVKIRGTWHATPWEHLSPGNSVCRTTEARSGQPPFIQGYGAIAGWYPKSGQEVAFMNTTIARGDRLKGTPYERSYIFMTKWP